MTRREFRKKGRRAGGTGKGRSKRLASVSFWKVPLPLRVGSALLPVSNKICFSWRGRSVNPLSSVKLNINPNRQNQMSLMNQSVPTAAYTTRGDGSSGAHSNADVSFCPPLGEGIKAQHGGRDPASPCMTK